MIKYNTRKNDQKVTKGEIKKGKNYRKKITICYKLSKTHEISGCLER